VKLYHLHCKQILPISIETAWTFFSNPFNLARITPPWLDLTITNAVSEKIFPGLIITYRLKTLFNLPTDWVTEITHVDKPVSFVDEMRLGPYLFWHHQHVFHEMAEGVEVVDSVHYALRFGWLGQLLHKLIVRVKLDDIFNYRREALKKIF
jgi:ligand-binding SRPBCC domain-containing protein